MTGPAGRRAAGSVLGGAGVLAVMGALHLLGSGLLSAPPLASVADLQAWAVDRGPVAVAMVTFRLLAIGVGYHLIATTALALLGRIVRWPGLVRLAEASTLPPLRGAFRRLAGLSMSASVVLVTPLPPVGATANGTATLTLVVPAGQDRRPVVERIEPSSPSSPSSPSDPPTARPAVLERIEPGVTGSSGTASLRPRPEPGASVGTGRATLRPAADPVPPRRPSGPGHHIVAAGDHLWAIAHDQVADHLGRQPSEVEIDPYWRTLLDANPQLVDPDLLFPGDRVVLPPLPGGHATLRARPTD